MTQNPYEQPLHTAIGMVDLGTQLNDLPCAQLAVHRQALNVHADMLPGYKALSTDCSPIYGPTDVPCGQVLPPGASKGAGVAQLLKLVDVSPEYVMALGDGENDIEMMQTVGWPVAMANAVPQVKAVSKAETLSNDEDGVAAALQRYVLDI